MRQANVKRAAILLDALNDFDKVFKAAENVRELDSVQIAVGERQARTDLAIEELFTLDLETGRRVLAAARDIIVDELKALGVEVDDEPPIDIRTKGSGAGIAFAKRRSRKPSNE